MRILLTNDDGIHGQGLEPLHRALSQLGEVFQIVPDQERSGVSHSLTLIKPLRVTEIRHRIYLVNGTPADCVRFGVMSIMNKKVDIVVSGINRGQNVGADVLYSGTVAAAREGALLNLPALAISLVVKGKLHFSTAAYFAKKLTKKIMEKKLPKQVYLNMNVPDLPRREIAGLEITRLGTRIYGSQIEQRTDPRGDKYYWIADENNLTGIKDPGTDIHAVHRNKVSVTPLQVDLTSYGFYQELKRWKI
ncbi:MAG: 5'/3'-nucleotidase SurE [Elusimicrobiota bacterium]